MKEPTLIELLRDPGAYISGPRDSIKMCDDAADEIERLRAALQHIYDYGMEIGGDACAEYAREALNQRQGGTT